MVGGTIHREVIHGEISRVLVLHPALATTRCASAARAELRLDNAFVLIDAPLGKSPTFAESAKIDWIRTKAPFAYPVFFGWRTKNLGRKGAFDAGYWM
jgi:hypothetical protein